MKAKIRFVKFEKALAMQVLEMDERFRGGVRKDNRFVPKNGGLEVKSGCVPSLTTEEWSFFLRGEERSEDFRISVKIFKSNSERDKALAKYIAALKDWAENWEGFKGTAEPPAASGDDLVVEV
jgi:hypothetical protein